MSTLSVQHWDEEFKLDQYCIDELHFWRTNLDSIKVRDCFLLHKPQRFAYSDASTTGYGSVITLNEDHICHRLWEPSECSKSSTWRELAAIDFSLESFAPILRGSLVKWYTDSQSAAKIVEVGSMKLLSRFSSFALNIVFAWRYNGSQERKMRRQITSVGLLILMIGRSPRHFSEA